MKVIPSNQTLILANERGTSGASPSTALARAQDSVPTVAVLRQVTIVSSRPDDMLAYLRANYGNPSPANRLPARLASHTSEPGAHGSSRGIALYASTQQISDARVAHIDVFA